MSPEKQRIAIAEACGWEDIAFDRGWKVTEMGSFQARIPDYLNDLNAMQSVSWLFLTGGRFSDKYTAYLNALEEVTETVHATSQQWAFAHATAAQRAEAFLRTLGKWEEA